MRQSTLRLCLLPVFCFVLFISTGNILCAGPCQEPPIQLSASLGDTDVCTGETVTVTATASDNDWTGAVPCAWAAGTVLITMSVDGGSYSSTLRTSFGTAGLHTLSIKADDVGGYYNDNPVYKTIAVTVHDSTFTYPTTGDSGSTASIAGCSSCSGVSTLGVKINMRDGAVSPELIGEATSLVGPYFWAVFDGASPVWANTTPGLGGCVSQGCSGSTAIRLGNLGITVDSGIVKINGIARALWNWDSGTRTLTKPDGSKYVFNSNGTIYSVSGSSDLRPVTFTYDGTFTDRVASATDACGNVWTYGVDSSLPGPSYVINPDSTKKVTFSYVARGSNGEGQFSRVIVYKYNSSWVEQYRIDYSYDSSDRVTEAKYTDADDAVNPSDTLVEYVSGTEGGRTDPVRRVYNTKLKVDVCYDYSTESISETYEGAKTYGVTQSRRRATCSSNSSYQTGDNSNTSDQVMKYYYYQDGSNNNTYTYKAVRMESDGSTGLQAYSTVKFQTYGYLTRFATGGGLPSDYAEEKLQGQPWKVVDARDNTITYEYSTENGLTKKVTLPTSDYSQTWFKQISSQDSVFVEKVRDTRGKYTRYTRDASYPALVTMVEVSDNDSAYTEIRDTSYYSSPDQKKGLVYQETVPDIESTSDMVTTYDYSEVIDSTTYYRTSPTTVTYSWWNGSSYENKTITTSYYRDGRVRWSKDALDNQTDYTYNNELKLTNTWLPADSSDTGSVDSYTSTTITDSSMTWYTNQLAGMALEITSGTYAGNRYPVTSNTATEITISGTLPNVSGANYKVRPYSETSYSACCGQVEWERDARGKKTYYEYSDAGKLTKTWTDISGQSSTYPLALNAYNDLGQNTTVTTYKDSSTGRTTTNTYDQQGRLIKVVYPGSGLLWDEYYQYDKNGNMVAKLDGTVSGGSITAGSVTAYEYDSLNRLTKVKYNYSAANWPISSISISSEDVSYTYSGGSGLKSQMVDSSGTSSYTYDSQGRLTTYTPPTTPWSTSYTVDYTYNNSGEKETVTVKESGTNKYKTSYSYFKNGMLKQVKGQLWNSGSESWVDCTEVNYSYDAAGKRTSGSSEGSPDILSAYSYDARGVIKSIGYKKSGDANDLYKMEYIRDGAGNPLQVAYSGDSYTAPYTNTNKVRYTYDEAARLTGEDWGYISGSWTSVNSTTWSYDWVGNRGTPGNYDAADRYLAGSGYLYDSKGNVEYKPDNTESTRQRFYYNGANLFSQIDDVTAGGTTTTTMTWDGDGNRLKLAKSNHVWWDVYDPVSSTPSVLFEIYRDDGDPPTYAYTYYVREPGGTLTASFDPDVSGDIKYYCLDALSSTLLTVNGSGTVLNSYTYGAWGTAASSSGTHQPYQYVGGLGYYVHSSDQNPSLSGLQQLGVRGYDPSIGRFLQRDPLGGEFSVYAYCVNNPLYFIDPSGKARWNPADWVRAIIRHRRVIGAATLVIGGAYTTVYINQGAQTAVRNGRAIINGPGLQNEANRQITEHCGEGGDLRPGEQLNFYYDNQSYAVMCPTGSQNVPIWRWDPNTNQWVYTGQYTTMGIE